jgi:DNA-binding MarR family transcriptional regulator
MKKTFEPMQLSTSEAIVLQQLHEDGEDDISLLSRQLGLPRGRILALVNSLKQKGLLIINHDYQGTWVRLSRKGNRLIAYLWPEMQLRGIY